MLSVGDLGIYVTLPILLEPQEVVSQALTLGLSPGAWLRRPLFGKYRRGPRHFGSHRAYLGYGLALSPIFKKAVCHTCLKGTREIAEYAK